MNLRRQAAAPALVALAAGFVAAGCTPVEHMVMPNQSPTVRITAAPLDTTQRNYYVITLNWIGFDPDGRVDHFLLAFDPPREAGRDTEWTSTTGNTVTRSFACPLPDRRDTTRSSDFHVFVIKAVDNQGARSPVVARAFWSYTIAPRVEMRAPRPNSLVRYFLPPAVMFQWEGTDEDGVFTQKPVKYKFKLLGASSEVPLDVANTNPDAVRQYYAPRYWAGWDSLPADTTFKQYTNLTPEDNYMFVVVAFDEAGAYSPIFSRNTNMTLFKVTFAGVQLPRIGFFNDFFLYEYEQGTYRPGDQSQVVHVEVPASDPGNPNDRLTLNWYASSPIGAPVRSYRWAVDITNLEDETRRTDEDTDLSHWSEKSSLITSCRIGPYVGTQTHLFVLEAEDINGLKALGLLEFKTVQSSFDHPLLVVDDTRYLLDEVKPNTNCFSASNRPLGAWPTQAEFDTFLYAVGGKPWKCYPPPGAVMSTPGIFHGYSFDTLGTNSGVADLTVKLSRLGQYRHVIWLVDRLGALNDDAGTNKSDAMTAMRYMNDRGKANTLAAYVRQGGLAWVVGNVATASMVNFDNPNNNGKLPKPATQTFSSAPDLHELIPGRFIYSQGHWQSEFKTFPITNGRVRRYLGRFESVPGLYAELPGEIEMKSSASDPFPPNRANRPSDFYQSMFGAEFLTAPNTILEDVDPGPRERFESTLDTLYKVTAASLQPDTGRAGVQSVVMTRYHGLENTELVVTGFPIWNFRRSQCQALVDFVLQRLWDLNPSAPSASMATPPPRWPQASTRAGVASGRASPPPRPAADRGRRRLKARE
jgi:hypothetical protein